MQINYGLLVAMGPILWLQGKYVRKVTPRLPEPGGDRFGITGAGPRLRLLITGDSAAAGVGAESQSTALSGQLLENLSPYFTVEWMLMAISGLDSPGLMKLIQNTPPSKFDVVVMSIGVNDVTSLTAPSKWLLAQEKLAKEIDKRFSPTLLIHSSVPPMERFTALPQPLRWFMGRWAAEMNRRFQKSLRSQSARILHHPFQERVPGGLASDGFHPGPLAYAVWARGLSQEILLRINSTSQRP